MARSRQRADALQTDDLRNVSLSLDSRPPMVQFNPVVAVHSTKPWVAVATWTDRSQSGIQIARTTDSGRHWDVQRFGPRDAAITDPCRGFEPSVAHSRRDHAFYIAFLCIHFSNAISELQLIKSIDNGQTWTPAEHSAVAVANHEIDDPESVDASLYFDWPDIAVDNYPSSPHYGRIYAGFVRFHFQPDGFIDFCRPELAYTDKIRTIDPQSSRWTRTPVMPDGDPTGPSAAAQVRLVVDDHGGVDFAYANENCNDAFDHSLLFRRSTDGGNSFEPLVSITKPRFFHDNPRRNDFLPHKDGVPISPSLAFNPVTQALEVVYQNNKYRETSAADISYQRSDDYGARWTPAQTISASQRGTPAVNDQFLPAIAADRVTGHLHAIWLDNRKDPGNRLVHTFQAFSPDDGRTWRSERITVRPWHPRDAFGGEALVGVTNAIDAAHNRIYPLWNDARNPGPVLEGLGGLDVFTNVEARGSPVMR